MGWVKSKALSILSVVGPDYSQILVRWPYPSASHISCWRGEAETEEVLLLWLCGLGQTHSLFWETDLVG